MLFYGALGKSRRWDLLERLGKKHKIRVESDLFGAELEDLLDRAKVVVNIHYYEGALLETTRIAQALSHGAQVVSETAADQERNPFYQDLVSFVPIGDVDALSAAITSALDRQDQVKAEVPAAKVADFDRTRFMLMRALFACGAITFQELWTACSTMKLQSDCVVLGLPESLDRHDFARARRLDGAMLFCGLRMYDGWKGCALSYKFLAMLARQQGFKSLTIYEDDADFGEKGAARLQTVRQYLAEQDGTWDIFSGLLSDLHDDAEILAVEDALGERFVRLNCVIGMVFGIYNATALKVLSEFRFEGENTAVHTIDRYLEARPTRCISLENALVEHCEDLMSTLWGNGNAVIVESIGSSQERLKAKVRRFLELDVAPKQRNSSQA